MPRSARVNEPTDYHLPTLTRDDVAAILQRTTRTVVRLVDSRLLAETRLPSSTGGRSLPRYSRAAVDAFLRSGYIK